MTEGYKKKKREQILCRELHCCSVRLDLQVLSV